MSQLHKRFTSDQIKELFDRYSNKKIERKYIQEILGIRERRFFMLLKQYRSNPESFTIEYQRTVPPRRISLEIEQNILTELSIDKELIQNKNVRCDRITTAISEIVWQQHIIRKFPCPRLLIGPKRIVFTSTNPNGVFMTEKS